MRLSRRSAMIASTMGFAAMFAGGFTWRAYSRGTLGVGVDDAYRPWAEWSSAPLDGPIAIARAGVLASKAYNTQPWLFHVQDDRIALYADRTRHIGTLDPFRREMHLSLGCALANMEIAARAQGFEPTIAYVKGRLDEHVAVTTASLAGLDPNGTALSEMEPCHVATLYLGEGAPGLLFTQDGHSKHSVKFAHEVFDILGPDVLLSHATGMTDEEIAIVARTGTKMVHNPSANAAIREHFRLVELLDAGVTVMLGSDGVAPDRSYDMFRHVFQAMRYHRAAFRDARVLPAGKVLEMVTVDAAKALGLEREIGSLEAGKKADVILLDADRPHMMPMQMPLYRVAYFANGNDVRTVIVNGRVLMRDRVVLTVDERQP